MSPFLFFHVMKTRIGPKTTHFTRSSFGAQYSISGSKWRRPFTSREKNTKRSTDCSAPFSILVAGTGIEPMSRGYEPRELPLLYPAILLYVIF